MKSDKKYDILIIGAGVIGCSIARSLSSYDLRIGVIEKSSYVCSGQSKANGGIIHAGHNSKPGTLKARLNVMGNRMFPKFCSDMGVEFKKIGMMVVADKAEKVPALEALKAQGIINGVIGLRIIGKEELLRLEPNIAPSLSGGLFIPSAGMVNVHRLVIASAEHAAVNGVDFIFNNRVRKLMVEDDKLKGAVTDKGKFYSKILINCAGTESGKIANSAGLKGYSIIPRKGEYYILDKKYRGLVRRPCFFTPNPEGKGVTVFPSSNGNVLFGGNSIKVEDSTDFSTTKKDFDQVYKKAQKLVPGIAGKEIIGAFAGIRSTSTSHDFIIEAPHKPSGFIILNGIDSPGLSSAPAISEHVTSLIKDGLMDLRKDPNKKHTYKIKPLFRELGPVEKELWIKKDKRFARIVCRCEEITEGDIVSAIHSPIPAETIDAVKFKTWAGAGRCQGGFDLERVLHILSRECCLPPENITKNGQGSNVVTGKTKVGL